MPETRYFVYVLRNPAGRLYIDFTKDLGKRIKQHQEGKAGWTRFRGPWELVYSEEYQDRIQAMRREHSLKTGKANQQLREHLNNNNR